MATTTDKSERSNFETWAREELERAGLFDKGGDYEGMIGEEVMRIFAEAGHSGFSAAYAASIFTHLSEWKPLTPLTSDPSEWQHIAEEVVGADNVWQSRRNPACFSNDGGRTYYDIDEKPSWLRRLAILITRKPLPKFHTAAHPDTEASS
ncbi:MAG TPA: hypothetical protein VFX35_01295 [Solirubrobacterales bacterium]|nr:hypothetical protein [Solirubrobacterales bacterium]